LLQTNLPRNHPSESRGLALESSARTPSSDPAARVAHRRRLFPG